MSQPEYRHIVRIANKDIDGQENLLQGLTRIRGIGLRISRLILNQLQLDPMNRIGYLTDQDVQRIEQTIDNLGKGIIPKWALNRPIDRISGKSVHLTGSDIDFVLRSDIERLKRIKCWRGIRHATGQKVRGQHTRSTGRKGVAVGVSRKRE